MCCHKQRYGQGRALRLWTRLGSSAFLLLACSGLSMRADTVRNDVKAYYGRVQSVGPAGVTLLMGCSGNAVQVIALANLNEVDFGGPCSTPKVTSSSSPSTAACGGPHGMLFTVGAKDGSNEIYLTVKSVTIQNGNAILTLRDGKEITGPSSSIERFFYRDECFRFLDPDPVWTSIFRVKTP